MSVVLIHALYDGASMVLSITSNGTLSISLPAAFTGEPVHYSQ